MSEQLISREEAIEHARRYAETHGREFQDPLNIQVQDRRIEDGSTKKPVKRPVYVMQLGSSRPMPVVEVDAIDGTVLEWRTFPR